MKIHFYATREKKRRSFYTFLIRKVDNVLLNIF